MLDISSYGAKCGIYAICIDYKVVYIGQSADLRTRAKQHYNSILSSTRMWYPLVREFHNRGHKITMRVLEQTKPDELYDREKKYIAAYNPLFNSQYAQEKYSPIPYNEAVNTLKLAYHAPNPKHEIPKNIETDWFGEEYTFRRW